MVYFSQLCEVELLLWHYLLFKYGEPKREGTLTKLTKLISYKKIPEKKKEEERHKYMNVNI